jgi:hypothetical protein
MGIIYEVSLFPFLLVTVVLGGLAAFMAGRAVALTWKPILQIVTYSVLLAAAARFLHFALFHGTLLSPYYFLVDLVVLLSLAWLGFQLTRAGQMAGQYGWLYERIGPLSWRERQGTAEPQR